MALTKTQVSQLYVAIFNRASDGEGNTYWQTAGESMIAVAENLIAHPDAVAYFGDALNNNEAFIKAIYSNTFDREADAEGLAYWLEMLDGGMAKGELVAHMVTSALATPEQALINKVAVSDYAADHIASATVDEVASFIDMIADVTADDATIAQGTAKVDAYEPTQPPVVVDGETYSLSATKDVLTGTDKNDLFEATVSQNALGQQTNELGTGDNLKGGAGVDTLDAMIETAVSLSGTPAVITPTTESVENVILHAEISDLTNATDTVVIDAKNMNGVLNLTSNHSDASVIIKNMIGPKKGVYGGTSEQTIAMQYTGNKDTLWEESDMTVYYDQDYLVRSSVESNSLYYFTQDRLAMQQDDKPFGQFTAVNGIRFKADGQLVEVKIEQATLDTFLRNVPANHLEAYKAFAKLLSDVLDAMDGMDGYSISLDENYFRTNGGQNNAGDPLADVAYAIVLTAPDGVKLSEPAMSQTDKFLPTYDMYNDTSADGQTTDIPVSINIDLEKVGNAADGGALTIGSMNKDGQNIFGHNQAITTTDTVAGFDEFNVHVTGDKSKNSSLSSLKSTDNTLRKVTIDSNDGSIANLTIGNSNTEPVNAAKAAYDAVIATAVDPLNPTTAEIAAAQAAYDAVIAGGFAIVNGLVGGTQTDESFFTNVEAFKDVQIMDASAFKGDLTLHAGLTAEIVGKYLANTTETTLYGLNNAKTEIAEFTYNGGAGNDTLDIALDLAGFADDNFVGTNLTDDPSTTFDESTLIDTNGINVFKMDIDGGAGNDTIVLSSGAAAGLYAGTQAITNITVNGGAGNDTIILDIANHDASTFNVAFEGTFGNDTITGFDVGPITLTNETQSLNVTGWEAHAGETIVVSVNGQSSTFNVTADMLDAGIATQITTILTGMGIFDTIAGSPVLNLTKNGENVNSVSVEIQNHAENHSYTTTHSTVSTTATQGGLLDGATGTGADTLDFSAWNVANLFVSTDSTVASLAPTAGTDISGATGERGSIYLLVDEHDSSVYNVFYNATATNADQASVNAATVLGSIKLQDETGLGLDLTTTPIDATQFLI